MLLWAILGEFWRMTMHACMLRRNKVHADNTQQSPTVMSTTISSYLLTPEEKAEIGN